ncbi:MAG: hypothetical protein CME71_12105 [Halobacteriovorax sp.]|nr:hypothetical protein [Halobacteriovorax sp.]
MGATSSLGQGIEIDLIKKILLLIRAFWSGTACPYRVIGAPKSRLNRALYVQKVGIKRALYIRKTDPWMEPE